MKPGLRRGSPKKKTGAGRGPTLLGTQVEEAGYEEERQDVD